MNKRAATLYRLTDSDIHSYMHVTRYVVIGRSFDQHAMWLTERQKYNPANTQHPSFECGFFHSLYFGSRLERVKILSLVCYDDIYETRYKGKIHW